MDLMKPGMGDEGTPVQAKASEPTADSVLSELHKAMCKLNQSRLSLWHQQKQQFDSEASRATQASRNGTPR